MNNPLLSAANEFGFSSPPPTASTQTASGSTSATQPGTTLSAVEATASGVWFRHPTVAIIAIVGLTALALERANRPIAHIGGRANAGVGPASGSAGGEIDV